LGFSLWLVLTIPFSIWRGGSVKVVEDYWRTNVVLVFLLGGLTTTWKKFERLLQVLAISCVVNLVIIQLYGELDIQGRLTLPFGALANSNDFAAHLLMLLPSVLWVALATESFKFRIVTLGVFGYGIFAALSSASRGALVAVLAGIAYFLFSASTRQRVWAVGLIAILLVVVFSLLPEQARQRIVSFSNSSDAASKEALASSEIRRQVLEDAVTYALKYPLFGLGPGNFSTIEGQTKPGMWEPAHNSYVTVASECGFPGLFLFLGGVGLSFGTFWRIGHRFKRNAGSSAVAQAAVCMQLMMVMVCIAVAFLNFGFAFHFPLIVGISIAMGYATQRRPPRVDSLAQTKNLTEDPEKEGEPLTVEGWSGSW
jgi:O-antigen ligase